MSAAMTHLVAQARSEEHPVEQENLYGQDLHLLITETGDGVTITLSRSPEAPVESPPDGDYMRSLMANRK